MATFRARKQGIPVTGCFSRAPMVMDRSTAKDSWKETLDILPKDVYTPMLDWEACVRLPMLFQPPSNRSSHSH